MKNRNNLNLLIDSLLTVNLAVLAGIGWLLKYTLPPGRDRVLRTGENRELFFLGWDRHRWGDVHLAAAFVMIGLLVLHIIFHWNQIVCLIRSAVPLKPLRRALTVGVILVSTAIFAAAFIFPPKTGDMDDFLYRHARGALLEPEVEPTPVAEKLSLSAEIPAIPAEGHQPGTGGEALLNGRLTLKEAAVFFKISVAEVKRRLGLPDGYSEQETLGRLRRTRGMTMIQIRELIEKRR